MDIKQELNLQYAIPVLRHQEEDTLYEICQALVQAGMKVLEVTLMSEAAYAVIKRLASEKVIVGAGTVLNHTQAKRALDAGASFLVSPGLNAEAVEYSFSQNVPFIPGVLTPTEIMKASQLGCELVKIFPVSSMGGPGYLEALKGPFPHVKWMATGGVSEKDIPLYKKAGAHCVGLGGNLTPKNLIEAKDWKALTTLAQHHLRAAQA